MDSTNLPNVLGFIAGGVGFCMAVYERYYSKKKEIRNADEQELVNSAKLFQEQAKLHREVAEENKGLYVKEKEDHQKTRDFYHDKINKDAEVNAKLQEKLLDAEQKPDLTDMVRELHVMGTSILAQGEVTQKILQILTEKKP